MSENKEIIGFKCKSCSKIHYPKHARCLKCKNREFEKVNLPKIGELLTYTILNAPPTGISKMTLYLGIIDLGETRYTGQIELDPKELKIGMKLKGHYEKVRTINNKDEFGFVWKKAD